MLLFRSEETVDRWCGARQIPRRPLVNLEQLWHLAVVWYENRLTAESRRPAPKDMVEIFASIGLEGPFWDPIADLWRDGSSGPASGQTGRLPPGEE